MPKIEQNLKAGLDYPEVFAVICAAVLMMFWYDKSAYILGFFALVTIGSLVIIWLSYQRINSVRISLVVVALMAIVMGIMQLCVPIFLGFVLLIGIRFFRSNPTHRFAVLTTAVLTTTAFYYISISLKIEHIACANDNVYLVLILTILITLWQFNQVHTSAVKYYEQATSEKNRISTLVSVINKLTRFLPPQVWQPIIRTNQPVVVTNRRRKITVMFSDIEGFTELSERLSPDELADILNTYMQRMTEIALHHDAVLDKFIGDGMVCFFGAPHSQGIREDALACVAMAIDMRREMRTLRHQWRLQGFEGLYIRIGITTGYCHVGNFGSDRRMSYTLIGSEANLASRLESAAPKGAILVSKSTYDYILHEYQCEFQGKIRLKGFAESVSTYTVLDPDATEGGGPKWVDHDLSGFNLHLNFKDIKNYDYGRIKEHLQQALKQVDEETRRDIHKDN